MRRPLLAICLLLAGAGQAGASVSIPGEQASRPSATGEHRIALRFEVPHVGRFERVMLRVRVVRGTRRPIQVRAGRRRIATAPGARDGQVLELDVTGAVRRRGGRHRLTVVSRGRLRLARPRLRIRYAGPATAVVPAHVPASPAPAPPTPGLPPADPPPVAGLAALLEDVRTAVAHTYAARDDAGLPLDGLQVLQTGPAAFLGVYHALVDGVFCAYVATSTDLLTWRRTALLDVHASQPAVAALPDGGYVVAYEADAPDGNRLRLRRYPSLPALLSSAHDREFTAPRTLSRTAEGTPSIRAAAAGADRLEVGFHRLTRAGVDRQALGVLERFARWRAQPLHELDAAFQALGTAGNLGDRSHASLPGRMPVELYEAQRDRGDWASWGLVLRDPRDGTLTPLAVRTHGASRAFANPALTPVELPGGVPAVVLTAFVPAEGAAPGEAGTLIAVHRR